MRTRVPIVLVLAASAALGLGACTAARGPEPVTSTSPTPEAVAPSPSSTDPAEDPDVAAARARFDTANRQLAASNTQAGDDAIVAALTAAGFDKGAMQITPDTTTIGRKADAIQVSVLVGTTCLLGQYRGASYVGETAPVLSTGRCLIGDTRALG